MKEFGVTYTKSGYTSYYCETDKNFYNLNVSPSGEVTYADGSMSYPKDFIGRITKSKNYVQIIEHFNLKF